MTETKEKTKANELLEKTKNDYLSMMSNIEWNMGNLGGLVYLLKNPNILKPIKDLPIIIDGLKMRIPQVLGIELKDSERGPRGEEILKAAKRMLIADAAELTVNAFYRMYQIVKTEKDPYMGEIPFSVKFVYLFGSKTKGPSKILTVKERKFWSFIKDLRDVIRHNNSVLIPGSAILFDGELYGIKEKVTLKWVKNGDNSIKLSLPKAHNLYKIIKESAIKFFEKQDLI